MSRVVIGQAAAISVSVALAGIPHHSLVSMIKKNKPHSEEVRPPSGQLEAIGTVGDQLAWRLGADPVVPVTAFLARWFAPTLDELERLAALPEGWDGYGSRPIQTAAHTNMLRALGIVAGVAPRPDLSPISGGALQMEWSIGRRDLEIVTRSDGSVTYLTMEGDDEGSIKIDVVDVVNYSDLLSRIGWLLGGGNSHEATA